MKALVYNGVKTLDYQEFADPDVGGDNLIAIESVGICGSDMHAYLGHDDRRPAPLILGHEAAGTVNEGPMKGKRVTVNPLVNCGTCPACREGRENLCPQRQIISMPPRQGGFAERVAMPSGNLVELPEGFAFDKAALAEPIAVCWHAIRLASEKLGRDLDGARCLVIGGGAIGYGSALSLRAFGAGDVAIAETNEGRQAYLKGRDEFAVLHPDDAKPDSYDLVVDAVGYRGTRALACALVQPGGAICHIGLGDANDGLDIRRMTLQEITFFGTYTYTAQDFRDTCAAMFDGRLGPLDWTIQMPLSEGAGAFADILNGQIAVPKVILHP